MVIPRQVVPPRICPSNVDRFPSRNHMIAYWPKSALIAIVFELCPAKLRKRYHSFIADQAEARPTRKSPPPSLPTRPNPAQLEGVPVRHCRPGRSPPDSKKVPPVIADQAIPGPTRRSTCPSLPTRPKPARLEKSTPPHCRPIQTRPNS
jgi:hypothetical protein